MTEDTKKTMERMGYPGMVDAVSFDGGLETVEIGLIAPDQRRREWAVAVHYGCDPDRETVGTSSFETFADANLAKAAFDKEVEDHRPAATVDHPGI